MEDEKLQQVGIGISYMFCTTVKSSRMNGQHTIHTELKYKLELIVIVVVVVIIIIHEFHRDASK